MHILYKESFSSVHVKAVYFFVFIFMSPFYLLFIVATVLSFVI